MKKLRCFPALFLILALMPLNAQAAPYPEKPIEWVIWSSPGGGADLFTRSMIRILEPIIKQTFVPVNKSGGGGAVGMAYASSRPADGYTLLSVTTNFVITPTMGKSPKGPPDFDPIARVAMETTSLAVKADAPWKNFDEFVKAAKDKGSTTIGIFGVGTQDHVAGSRLAQLAGIKVRWVPFEGGADGNAALLGGHIDAMINNPSELAEQVATRQMRMLGVFSEGTWPFAPEVKSFKQQGYDVVMWQWRGIVAPKGVPPAVLDRLGEVVKQGIETEGFKKYLTENELLAAYMDRHQFKTFVDEQLAIYQKALTDLGMAKK
jgi:tripartite-type tricarboxylate transporter receptor subunit TctC